MNGALPEAMHWGETDADAVRQLLAEITELRGRLARQTDNMAFVLNHADVGTWYERFTRELAEDRLDAPHKGPAPEGSPLADLRELSDDLMRRAVACRDLRHKTNLLIDKERLHGKSAAYGHAAELLRDYISGCEDANPSGDTRDGTTKSPPDDSLALGGGGD